MGFTGGGGRNVVVVNGDSVVVVTLCGLADDGGGFVAFSEGEGFAAASGFGWSFGGFFLGGFLSPPLVSSSVSVCAAGSSGCSAGIIVSASDASLCRGIRTN